MFIGTERSIVCFIRLEKIITFIKTELTSIVRMDKKVYIFTFELHICKVRKSLYYCVRRKVYAGWTFVSDEKCTLGECLCPTESMCWWNFYV